MGRGGDVGAFQDLPDRRRRDLHSQHSQFTVDAPITPVRILVGQAQDQSPDRGEHPWSTRVPWPAVLRVTVREQGPVPPEHGVGADQ